jgi:hypothetical protein
MCFKEIFKSICGNNKKEECNSLLDENDNLNSTSLKNSIECKHCNHCFDCNRCENCDKCKQCSNSYNCTRCTRCYNCSFLVGCKDCANCKDCENCEGCEYSNGLVSAKGIKNYCISEALEYYLVRRHLVPGYRYKPDKLKEEEDTRFRLILGKFIHDSIWIESRINDGDPKYLFPDIRNIY